MWTRNYCGSNAPGARRPPTGHGNRRRDSLGRLYSVGRDGKVIGKAEELASLKADTVLVCNVDQMQVRVYGDAAVVVGRLVLKATIFKQQVRFADTYILRNGHWRCDADANTKIKP